MQNVTGNSNFTPYLDNFLKDTVNKFEEAIRSIKQSETVIIYGCGEEAGIPILKKLKYKNNVLFCDRLYEIKKEVHGLKVISPNELVEKYKNNKVILGVGEATKSVYNFLVNNKIKEENIIVGSDKNLDLQYFDDVIKLNEEEVFVDAGGFNGQTSVLFAEKTNFKYNKIYIFEPDERNLELIEDNENFHKLKNTKLIKKGCWDKEELLKFNSNFLAASTISSQGDIEINCDSLDNMIGNNAVTYIKMDIEGAELNALIGAKNLIKQNKPKLAISIYHKPEDIVDIPIYIKSLVPEYKIYLRHYSSSFSETILYAVIE